jgi:hypothetical protein
MRYGTSMIWTVVVVTGFLRTVVVVMGIVVVGACGVLVVVRGIVVDEDGRTAVVEVTSGIVEVETGCVVGTTTVVCDGPGGDPPWLAPECMVATCTPRLTRTPARHKSADSAPCRTFRARKI